MSHKNTNLIPTLLDVARLAGVSTATVSRCLNDPDRVVAGTRDKVLAAVKELGYAPNFSARALAAKRTNTVGAVIPTMDNAIFARGLQAFQEELYENNITLLVASSQYNADIEEAQIRNLVARGADALLLIGYDRSEETYKFLADRSVATVVAWAFQQEAKVMTVGFDNREAMKALANEVLSLGHRQIGFISASRQNNDRARERIEGVREAMSEQGVSQDALKIIETPYSIENGVEACKKLLRQANRPTVIMCGNDVLAVGAVRAAQQLGLDVPGDVSITGFDDIELASVISPPLTTVHVPYREMGRSAAAALVSLLRGQSAGESRKLSTSLQLRETLGEAPSAKAGQAI